MYTYIHIYLFLLNGKLSFISFVFEKNTWCIPSGCHQHSASQHSTIWFSFVGAHYSIAIWVVDTKTCSTLFLFSKNKSGASRLAGLAKLGLLSLISIHNIIWNQQQWWQFVCFWTNVVYFVCFRKTTLMHSDWLCWLGWAGPALIISFSFIYFLKR